MQATTHEPATTYGVQNSISDRLIPIAAILGELDQSPLIFPCNLSGSHRLKSRSYQIRNLKNLLTGSPADLYLLRLLKALVNH